MELGALSPHIGCLDWGYPNSLLTNEELEYERVATFGRGRLKKKRRESLTTHDTFHIPPQQTQTQQNSRQEDPPQASMTM